MAGPKSDKDQYFGLTPSQAKMILIGALYTEDAKPDLTRLAKKANITVSSARTMYPKAMKRWRELQGCDDTSLEGPTPVADDEEAPKETHMAKKPRARGRKRKHDEGEPAPEIEEYEEQPEYELEPEREDEPAELHREEHLEAELRVEETQSVCYDADDGA